MAIREPRNKFEYETERWIEKPQRQATSIKPEGFSVAFDRLTSLDKRWRPPTDSELEHTFRGLKERWQEETMFLSSTTELFFNTYYQQIIGLGPHVIPLLLRDLDTTGTHWFWALYIISREDPVRDEDRGNVRNMADSWLEWGRRKGYI